jgi:hypothetical protein
VLYICAHINLLIQFFSNLMKNLLPITLLMIALLAINCKSDTKPEAQVPAKDPRIEVAPVQKTNPFEKNTCDLITDDDIKKLFNIDPKMANKRTADGSAACMWYWDKPDWKEREANNEKKGNKFMNPRVMLSVKVVNDYTDIAAKNQFDMILRDKTAKDQVLEGIGQAAVWRFDYSNLQILKGHLIVFLTLTGEDVQEENIPKLKELAQLVLAKLP